MAAGLISHTARSNIAVAPVSCNSAVAVPSILRRPRHGVAAVAARAVVAHPLAMPEQCPRCKSAADPAWLGWSHGFHERYALGPRLGAGCFGTVHEAKRRSSGMTYAVKVLRKRPGSGPLAPADSCSQCRGGGSVEAIAREADAWARVQGSSFVARLEGLLEDESNAYIVQELAPGGSLQQLLSSRPEGKLAEHEACAVMRGVLDVLAECRAHGVVYGDLKPANVLFSASAAGSGGDCHCCVTPPLPSVRIVDFGTARVSQGPPLLGGSPVYSAPEVACERYGYAADLWSAGVLLYQVLTGRLPFWPRCTPDKVSQLPAWEVLAGARTREVTYPSELWASVSAPARDLVACMLDRRPGARPSAEAALAHPWLESVLGYVPQPSRSAGLPAATTLTNNVLPLPSTMRGNSDSQQQQQQQQQQPKQGVGVSKLPQKTTPEQPSPCCTS